MERQEQAGREKHCVWAEVEVVYANGRWYVSVGGRDVAVVTLDGGLYEILCRDAGICNEYEVDEYVYVESIEDVVEVCQDGG